MGYEDIRCELVADCVIRGVYVELDMGGDMKVRSVGRRYKPYDGGDVLAEWHKAKTKSSMSEAFKDADYATPIWRCETENQRGWRIVRGWVAVLLGIGLAYFIAVGAVDWLKGLPNG